MSSPHSSGELIQQAPPTTQWRTLKPVAYMIKMMATSDPLTSIPVHRSTLRVLQRVKSAAETWDEFLEALTDDYISPSLRSELDKRLTREGIVPGPTAKKEFAELRRRAR